MDKRSVGIAGKGMPSKWIICKRGVDPPKNSAGKTGALPYFESMKSVVSTGNGSCITVEIFSKSEPVTESLTSHTRSTCLSAETMLSSQDALLLYRRLEW